MELTVAGGTGSPYLHSDQFGRYSGTPAYEQEIALNDDPGTGGQVFGAAHTDPLSPHVIVPVEASSGLGSCERIRRFPRTPRPQAPPPFGENYADSASGRSDAGVGNRSDCNAVQTGPNAPFVSVIIACRNAERYVGHQLEALAAQEISVPWELVFVDNGSTDRSVQVAESYRDRIQMRVVSAPELPNQAYARNVGADAASADKLVFVDADDEVAPGFLTSMFAMLQQHDFVASLRDDAALNPEWTRHAQNTPESSHGTFTMFAFGAAVGLSRAVLLSVGGWPEEYVPNEDMALSFRLQRSGVPLVYLPEPLLRYRFRESIRGLFSQTRRWGYQSAHVHRDFGAAFAARRPVSLAVSEWLAVLRQLATARNRADLARCAVRLGYSVGRLMGSLRYRVFYL